MNLSNFKIKKVRNDSKIKNIQNSASNLQPKNLLATQIENDKEMAKIKGRLNKLKSNYRHHFSSSQMDRLNDDPYKT